MLYLVTFHSSPKDLHAFGLNLIYQSIILAALPYLSSTAPLTESLL